MSAIENCNPALLSASTASPGVQKVHRCCSSQRLVRLWSQSSQFLEFLQRGNWSKAPSIYQKWFLPISVINDYLLPKRKQKWTAQGKKVDRHKETKKNSSLVLGLQQIKIKSNVFESLVSPKKTLNTIWTSDGRLNIWSARQARKTTQRFKVKVALTYADSASLPSVLQILKGHPLFTMITLQNIGKGLEVVASPADPRLQRYVSL